MSSTTTTSLPTTSGPVILTGTPVVPGVVLGPVVRPAGAVRLPTDDQPQVPEEARLAEEERVPAGAETVARGLRGRAGLATGVSAEVLTTTAGIAADRALRTTAEQRIDTG